MMKRVARATLALSLGLAAAGCNSPSAPACPRAANPVNDRQTLGFLASPELEGRGVGTQGLDRAADHIAAEFKRLGLRTLPGYADYFQPFEVSIRQPPVRVKNVIGYVPGKRSDEFIVIGAHYDHLGRGRGIASARQQIHPGADDNASGTTAMLMLAWRFSRQKNHPERSIIFAAFAAEEPGMIGSRRFVSAPPVPLSQLVAMVNLDMIGRVRTTATQPAEPILYVGGSGTAPAFDEIVRQADARSPLEIVALGRGGIGPSDHMNFALKKIPVLFLFSGLHPDYHQPSDVAEKINYRGIEEVVDFAADIVTQLTTMPRQTYVASYDALPLHLGLGRVLNSLLTPLSTQGYSSTQESAPKDQP